MGASCVIGIRSLFGPDAFQAQYKLGKKLGEGNFGQVRVATVRSSKEVRAVKIIDGRPPSYACSDGSGAADRTMEQARREAELMKLVAGHKHCLQLFATFECNSCFYVVMEMCQVSLMDRIDEVHRSGEGYLARLFRDILLGIAHVHSLNIVHRDIKPCNILFGGKDGETVKLCDFGMAEELPASGGFTAHCGTAPYMSPELVSMKSYDFKADVWSTGVTAYMLLYGVFPYMPKDEAPMSMKRAIYVGKPAPQFTPAPNAACSGRALLAEQFVQALLTRDQRLRCTAEAALRLPFVEMVKDMPSKGAEYPSLLTSCCNRKK